MWTLNTLEGWLDLPLGQEYFCQQERWLGTLGMQRSLFRVKHHICLNLPLIESGEVILQFRQMIPQLEDFRVVLGLVICYNHQGFVKVLLNLLVIALMCLLVKLYLLLLANLYLVLSGLRYPNYLTLRFK